MRHRVTGPDGAQHVINADNDRALYDAIELLWPGEDEPEEEPQPDPEPEPEEEPEPNPMAEMLPALLDGIQTLAESFQQLTVAILRQAAAIAQQGEALQAATVQQAKTSADMMEALMSDSEMTTTSGKTVRARKVPRAKD